MATGFLSAGFSTLGGIPLASQLFENAPEWPSGHSYAVVATAFHGGGAVLGTMATEDEAWAIYDQWPTTDCRCGCRGIVTRDGFRLRRSGSPQKILDD